MRQAPRPASCFSQAASARAICWCSRLPAGTTFWRSIHDERPESQHARKEALKIVPFQRLHLLLHPGGFRQRNASRAKRARSPRRLAGRLEICVEFRLVHLAQHLLAEHAGYAAHFLGDGGVFVRQICVIRAGIERAERVAAVRKNRMPPAGRRGAPGRQNR